MELYKYITEFMEYYVKEEKIEIYNEFSLQHELGIFLRERIQDYKIQFERNVSFFGIKKTTIKREIDISIFSPDEEERYAIELKFPLNGQYPEQMYSFIKDMKFMEELKLRGFNKTFCLTVVYDKAFSQGENNNGIYNYFRAGETIGGTIFKPTGKLKNVEKIVLNGEYNINWNEIWGYKKYYIVEI